MKQLDSANFAANHWNLPDRLPAPPPCPPPPPDGAAGGGGGGMAGWVLPGDSERGRGVLWQGKAAS